MRRLLAWFAGGLLLLLLIVPLLVPVRPMPGVGDPRTLADAESRFLDIAHPGLGPLAHHYRVFGETPPSIVLLHGFTLNLYSWSEVQRELAAVAGVAAYDRVPFGLSAKPGRAAWTGGSPYAAAAAEQQLFDFMDALDIDRGVLVGNSAGGLLAVRAALDQPDRVAGLVLVNAAILTRPPAFVAPLLRLPPVDHLGPLLARGTGQNLELLRSSYADPGRITPERERLTTIMTRTGGWDSALWDFVIEAAAQPDVSAGLGRIGVPTLVMVGAEDRVVPPADGDAIAAAIPGSELVVIEGCGHVLQEECPAAFVSAFADWFAREVRDGLAAAKR